MVRLGWAHLPRALAVTTIVLAVEMLLFDQGFGKALVTAIIAAVLLVAAVEAIERLRRKRARADHPR